jgi:hypothetical protein
MIINGEKVPAFSATTLSIPKSPNDNLDAIIESSRELYSRPRAEVEEEIRETIEASEKYKKELSDSGRNAGGQSDKNDYSRAQFVFQAQKPQEKPRREESIKAEYNERVAKNDNANMHTRPEPKLSEGKDIMFHSSQISESKSFNPAAAHVKSLQTAHKTTYENNRLAQRQNDDSEQNDRTTEQERPMNDYSAIRNYSSPLEEQDSNLSINHEPPHINEKHDRQSNDGSERKDNTRDQRVNNQRNNKKSNKNRTKRKKSQTPQEAFRDLKISPNTAEEKDRPSLKDLGRLVEEQQKENKKEKDS